MKDTKRAEPYTIPTKKQTAKSSSSSESKKEEVSNQAILSAIIKRPPIRSPTLENDVYVSRKTRSRAALKRIQHLLESKRFQCVTIHGLGAMVPKAVNLALEFQRDIMPESKFSVSTSSVVLMDEVLPEDKDDDSQWHKRTNSAVHIKLSLT